MQFHVALKVLRPAVKSGRVRPVCLLKGSPFVPPYVFFFFSFFFPPPQPPSLVAAFL